MLYQALRPCRFDRWYLTGEIIPGQVILPEKVPTLMQRGRIRLLSEKALAKELQSESKRLETYTKEQLWAEIVKLTGKQPAKRSSKKQLIQILLETQAGDGHE